MNKYEIVWLKYVSMTEKNSLHFFYMNLFRRKVGWIISVSILNPLRILSACAKQPRYRILAVKLSDVESLSTRGA